MITDTYRDALHGALKKGVDPRQAMSRLAEILKRNGHFSLYSRILQGTKMRFQKEEAKTTMTVTVARESDGRRFKKEIASLSRTFGASQVETVVDESIIGGFIATGSEQQLDASYKKSLLLIYKSLVT